MLKLSYKTIKYALNAPQVLKIKPFEHQPGHMLTPQVKLDLPVGQISGYLSFCAGPGASRPARAQCADGESNKIVWDKKNIVTE